MLKIMNMRNAAIALSATFVLVVGGLAVNEELEAQAETRNQLVQKSETVVFEVSDIPAPDWMLETPVAVETEEEVVAEEPTQVEYVDHVSYAAPTQTYISSSNGLTRSQGVNYYDGRRETWYSSNVLRHYMTDQWHTDENGVYRDSDGYVVVAASDLGYGSLVETSHGTAKVYDTGCAPGTTDIYTKW